MLFPRKPKTIEKLKQFLLSFSSNSKQYVSNTIWLITDKILRQGVSFFIGIWIARYLGPKDFGIWNYVIAICAIFTAFSSLGIESILIRELVKKDANRSELMGTAARLKFFGALVALALSCITIVVADGYNPQLLLIGLITASAFLFQSFDVIDYYYQSLVQSKYVIYARIIAFSVTSLLKVGLILSKQSLILFVWVTFLEIAITAIALFIFHLKQHRLKWNWNKNTASYLLKEGWPLALTGIVIMLYMRIDQVMLGQIRSKEEVGIYSAAVKVCELWYFIPMMICSSIYPGLVKARETNITLYFRTLKWLYAGLFWISLLSALGLTLFSVEIIDILYGQAYISAPGVLTIYSFAGIATFLGVASSQYLLVENFTMISLYRTSIGLGMNLVLNFILIPKYGAQGAAFATLVSYTFATFSLVLFKQTQKHTLFILRSLVPIKSLTTFIKK